MEMPRSLKRALAVVGLADLVITYSPWLVTVSGLVGVVLSAWSWLAGLPIPIALLVGIATFVSLFVGTHDVARWLRNRGINVEPKIVDIDGKSICTLTVTRGWGTGTLKSCTGYLKEIYKVDGDTAHRLLIPSTYLPWSSRTGSHQGAAQDIVHGSDIEVGYFVSGKELVGFHFCSIDEEYPRRFHFSAASRTIELLMLIEVASENARKQEMFWVYGLKPREIQIPAGSKLQWADDTSDKINSVLIVGSLYWSAKQFRVNKKSYHFVDHTGL